MPPNNTPYHQCSLKIGSRSLTGNEMELSVKKMNNYMDQDIDYMNTPKALHGNDIENYLGTSDFDQNQGWYLIR